MKEKVLLALSGGVDSSVAAILLQNSGYEVVAATIKMHDFSESSIDDAKKICDQLNIQHIVIDAKQKFYEIVMQNFYDEYMLGKTPNPCVLCNYALKWQSMIDKANELKIEKIATGHYAFIKYYENLKRFSIIKSKDETKDQTYVLWRLPQNFLARTIFPLSDIATKAEIRKIAYENNLPSFNKDDSQDICFIPDNDYRKFLKEFNAKNDLPTIGDIILDNKKVGSHSGYYNYTIGQRRGLGVSHACPLYVKKILPEKNQIIVAEEKDLYNKGLIASHINLLKYTKETFPEKEFLVKIRYKDNGKLAKCKIIDEKLEIIFAEPRKSVTLGQSAVLYDNNELIGGGIIEQVIE